MEQTKMFLVVGVMNSGSGSLTFPEDFDIHSVHTTRGQAQLHANNMNDQNDNEDEDDDIEDDVMKYEVYEVPLISE